MMFYRRGVRCPAKNALTVDKVLCATLPVGHLTAHGKYLCFHNMQIRFPETLNEGDTAYIILQPPPSSLTTFPATIEPHDD